MKHKFSKVFFVVVMLLVVCLLAVACNPDDQGKGGNKNPEKYAVSYVGGDGATGNAPTGESYVAGAKVTLPGKGTLDKAGNKFDGWSYGGQTYKAGVEFTMPANAVVFTAVWIPKETYIVSFAPDGYAEGENPTAETVYEGDSIELIENPYTAKAEYTGYVFKGWYVAEDGRNSKLYQPGDSYTPTATVSMIAKFASANAISVTYKAGENATGNDVVREQDKNINFYPISINATSFVPESGYNFEGWKLQGDDTDKLYNSNEECSFATDVTFIAQWSRNSQFAQHDTTETATFVMILSDSNTGSGFIEIYSDTIGASSTKVNFTYTLTGNAISVTLANDGGTFTGTFANDVLTITITYNSKNYEFKKAEVPVGAPTVSFNANGGSGAAPQNVTIVYNDNAGSYKITAPQNTFTAPAGMEFDTWEVMVNGISAGNRKPNISTFADSGAEVVFKAIWKSTSVAEITGTTYNGNCTVPVHKLGQIDMGGYTYTQFVVNFDTNQVAYLTSGENQKVVVSATPVVNNIPAIYANATCYEVRLGDNLAYYLIFNADKTKLTIRESAYDDTPIANSEFTKEGTSVDDSKYNVTYSLGEMTGTEPESSQVAVGGAFVLPVPSVLGVYEEEDGYSYMTKIFVGWNDGTNVYPAGATYNMPADDVSFTAVVVAIGPGQTVGQYSNDYYATIVLNVNANYPKAGVIIIGEPEAYHYFTCVLNGEDITIKIAQNVVATGKYNTTDGFTMTLTVDGHQYVFGYVEPTKPTLNFSANGGSGNGPDVESIVMTYNSNTEKFDITLPANPYTAPNGQEFDKWSVNNAEVSGTTYSAIPGATLNIKPIWKDTLVVEGIEFNGSVTVNNTTFVKVIVNFDDLAIYYYLSGDNTVKVGKQVTDKSTGWNWKPTVLGSDAYYFRFDTDSAISRQYYLLINSQKTLLKFCDDDDNVLTSDEEFITEDYDPNAGPSHPETVTVTFDLNYGEVAGDFDEQVIISYNETVTEPSAIPVRDDGKYFRYWCKSGNSSIPYDFDTPVTQDITLEAVYQYKITYDAGEGTGSIEPDWATSSYGRIFLPDGSDLHHDSKTFDGWSDGTSTYAGGTQYTVMGSVTLTAVWKSQTTPPAPTITSGTYVGSYNGCTQITATFSNSKVVYILNGTSKTSWGSNASSNADKPQIDGYGNDTLYISFKFDGVDHYLLISTDRTKATLCDKNNNQLAEFTLQA